MRRLKAEPAHYAIKAGLVLGKGAQARPHLALARRELGLACEAVDASVAALHHNDVLDTGLVVIE